MTQKRMTTTVKPVCQNLIEFVKNARNKFEIYIITILRSKAILVNKGNVTNIKFEKFSFIRDWHEGFI